MNNCTAFGLPYSCTSTRFDRLFATGDNKQLTSHFWAFLLHPPSGLIIPPAGSPHAHYTLPRPSTVVVVVVVLSWSVASIRPLIQLTYNRTRESIHSSHTRPGRPTTLLLPYTHSTLLCMYMRQINKHLLLTRDPNPTVHLVACSSSECLVVHNYFIISWP